MSSGDVTNGNDEELPEIDFVTFVLSLNQSALVHLGDAPDPNTRSVQVHLPLARQTIDMLAMIQEKTRNNLDGEEERVLSQVLYDLRSRFVQVAKSQ